MERVELIRREIDGVKAQSGITSWEDTFLSNVGKRWRLLSPLQEEHLRKIEIKVFGEDYDPHTGDLFS